MLGGGGKGGEGYMGEGKWWVEVGKSCCHILLDSETSNQIQGESLISLILH